MKEFNVYPYILYQLKEEIENISDVYVLDRFQRFNYRHVNELIAILRLPTCRVRKLSFRLNVITLPLLSLATRLEIVEFTDVSENVMQNLVSFLTTTSAHVLVKRLPIPCDVSGLISFLGVKDGKFKLSLPITEELNEAIETYTQRTRRLTAFECQMQDAGFLCGTKAIIDVDNPSYLEFMTNGTITNVEVSAQSFVPTLVQALNHPGNRIRKLTLENVTIPNEVWSNQFCVVESLRLQIDEHNFDLYASIGNGHTRFKKLILCFDDELEFREIFEMVENPNLKVRILLIERKYNFNVIFDDFIVALRRSNITFFDYTEAHRDDETTELIHEFNIERNFQQVMLTLLSPWYIRRLRRNWRIPPHLWREVGKYLR